MNAPVYLCPAGKVNAGNRGPTRSAAPPWAIVGCSTASHFPIDTQCDSPYMCATFAVPPPHRQGDDAKDPGAPQRTRPPISEGRRATRAGVWSGLPLRPPIAHADLPPARIKPLVAGGASRARRSHVPLGGHCIVPVLRHCVAHARACSNILTEFPTEDEAGVVSGDVLAVSANSILVRSSGASNRDRA